LLYPDASDVDGLNARVLIEDGPPQALEDLTHVRITAIVKSDERVTYEAEKQDPTGCVPAPAVTASSKSVFF